MKKFTTMLLVIVLTAVSLATSALAGEVSITAAADLQYAMKDIIAAFEARNPGDKVNVVFGSSGKALSQIENGAPYDIFFSADIGYPQKLKKSGAAISEPKPYAIGRIVLWATKRSGIDVNKGINALFDPKVKKIAIANPLHAPYGRIAQEVMEHYKVYDKVKSKVVLGENIQQTAQFIQSGAADIGFVAYSLALSQTMSKEGNYFLLPATAHKEIIQGYVLLKPAAKNATAAKFEKFTASSEARTIFKRYGFVLPNE
ncbi:molybdate ABC transporter substrate-binding protein [Geobacter sp. FeAm09]|uniref:molybdate ABC transporter substrate-binding protein n=1 Tax=Geobacter sp. FeAm09 TaxID=2597769 RepID=UPI0011EDA0D9|nr:molybdate ABC transporter substrate-binding protein [Geobacter sp. FeAm09]QEM67845.1 molybdate ABC transporter substrate-binding protein [Geobacter sp. FeAm09]